ncbi:MAG: four-carbon acid sugar kinase family protein [Desulfobacterales bacterium]|nr:four-carbon acid sugar kinase family protein [Desulfobacterales bacterium]
MGHYRGSAAAGVRGPSHCSDPRSGHVARWSGAAIRTAMNSELEIVVIADDLTGAADAGVQFCSVVGTIYLTGPDVPELSGNGRITAGLAVFTNTRHMAAAEAGKIAGNVAMKIRSLQPRMVYKKIDSCLRGNIGPETEALILAMGYKASFVAPAFPQQGRITVDDLHQINGVPVAETEIGRDPLCPVRESRLSVLLSGQCRLPVGHVDLASVEKGPDTLVPKVQTLLKSGCRHIAFDASRQEHLNTVANLARHHFNGILLVGSAGLAAGLAGSMGVKAVHAAPSFRPKLKKPLFICGSASRVLAAQREVLVRHTGFPEMALDPELLSLPEAICRRSQLAENLAATWLEGGLVLCIAPFSPTSSVAVPDRVIQGFAEVAASLIRLSSPDGVFLSGGDTAESVCKRIGAEAIRLIEEVLPGLMRGKLIGGRHDGLSVVTKAGAFGPPQTLVQLLMILS